MQLCWLAVGAALEVTFCAEMTVLVVCVVCRQAWWPVSRLVRCLEP
jgi:hypothetical protein